MMAANSKNNYNNSSTAVVAEEPTGGGTNWLMSIGLSVSQLFTGSGAATTTVDPPIEQDSGADKDSVQGS